MPASRPPETRNAFSVLMSSASAPASPPRETPAKRARTSTAGRDALAAYIHAPSRYPPSTVVAHTAASVSIRDRYPKSVVHTLLLPRDASRTHLSPLDAFDDPAFLACVRDEVSVLRRLVASELRRKYGDQDGRDWEREVMAGVHAKPSMNNLHVHVMGVDRGGAYMKSKKHYLTFMRPFFIGIEELPLSEGEKRRRKRKEEVEASWWCWRCRRSFEGMGWPKVRAHLDREFERWKVEGVKAAGASAAAGEEAASGEGQRPDNEGKGGESARPETAEPVEQTPGDKAGGAEEYEAACEVEEETK